MLPLYLVEEHHEAFFVWQKAIIDGVIPPQGNALLHVDDHADFTPPRLTCPIGSVGGSLKDWYRFTIEQLSIATFIMPAIYRGIFNRTFWLRCNAIAVNTEQKGLVYSHKREDEKLLYALDTFENRLSCPGAKGVSVNFQTRYEHFPEDQPVVLDIDLDYFSANIPPDGFEMRFETTEAEFAAFQSNPYHPLRLIAEKVVAEEENGRCYFVYHRVPRPLVAETKVSEEKICERIDEFLRFLETKRVKPLLIDVCRSRFSHYTPADQWQFIEKCLLAGLHDLYSTEEKYIGDIVSEGGLWKPELQPGYGT